MNKSRFTLSIIYSLLLPTIVILTLWILEARIINSPLVLPQPSVVFSRLFSLIQTGEFWLNFGVTTLRTLYSFGISLGLSILLGTFMGLFPPIAAFFSLPLGIIKSAPVISFILLAIFWFPTNSVSVFIGVLMTLPIMTSSLASGIKNVNIKLIDMANIYQFTRFQKIIHLYSPSVMPFFLAGCLTAFSLSWKVVVAAEVLSLPSEGMGTALHRSKTHIETADVFAYTIAIIFVSFTLERLLALVLGKRLPQQERLSE